MSPLEIRPFVMGDWPAAWTLWSRELAASHDDSWSRERTAAFLDRNPGLSFSATLDGILAGTVMTGHDGRRAYIYHLAVDRAHRRRGIGRALLCAARDALAAQGIEKYHLFVKHNNAGAMEFYRNMDLDRRDDLVVWSRTTKKE